MPSTLPERVRAESSPPITENLLVHTQCVPVQGWRIGVLAYYLGYLALCDRDGVLHTVLPRRGETCGPV